MFAYLFLVLKNIKSPFFAFFKDTFLPVLAMFLEIRGNLIFSFPKATNTIPEQSIPVLVVPPYLYFTPLNFKALATIFSALFRLNFAEDDIFLEDEQLLKTSRKSKENVSFLIKIWLLYFLQLAWLFWLMLLYHLIFSLNQNNLRTFFFDDFHLKF